MVLEFSQWQEVEIKSAIIKEAEEIEGKDKLYKLSVDVGEAEPRTMVAGIKPWYSTAELKGKIIIAVTNLKPAKIAGIESNGMLLAIMGKDGKPILVTTEEQVEPGKRVE